MEIVEMVRETFIMERPRTFSHLQDLLQSRYGMIDSGRVDLVQLAVALDLDIPGYTDEPKAPLIEVTGEYAKAKLDFKSGKLKRHVPAPPETSKEVQALQLDLADAMEITEGMVHKLAAQDVAMGKLKAEVTGLENLRLGITTVDEMQLLQVDDLKKILNARGLPLDGLKDDLVKRILTGE